MIDKTVSELNINLEDKNIFLYNYVIPTRVSEDKNFIVESFEDSVGFIGLNRTYNFLINSQIKARWYENIYEKNKLDKKEISKWISKTYLKKTQNNLKF